MRSSATRCSGNWASRVRRYETSVIQADGLSDCHVTGRGVIGVATEVTDARSGTIDPLGAAIEDGPELYFMLIRDLAAAFKECLAAAYPDGRPIPRWLRGTPLRAPAAADANASTAAVGGVAPGGDQQGYVVVGVRGDPERNRDLIEERRIG